MYRVDMTSNDIDRQIALLKFYPELVEKHFKSGLKNAASMGESAIRPNIPVLSGQAKNEFGSRVTGKGIDMQAQIGWWGQDKSWYMNIVEYGAVPHAINSYVPRIGVFIKQHPGFSARGFMAAGFFAIQPTVNAEMLRASNALVNEMAVK